MNEHEAKHLEKLLVGRERAKVNAKLLEELVEDFALELIAGGASVRTVAEAAGVGTSTVQGWINKARRRADEQTSR